MVVWDRNIVCYLYLYIIAGDTKTYQTTDIRWHQTAMTEQCAIEDKFYC